MTAPLFLTDDEVRTLTGRAHKDKQIAHLRMMGIAFRLNACGKPVVTRSAVEGSKNPQVPTAWIPTVLLEPRNAA